MAHDSIIKHAVRNAYVYNKQPLSKAASNAGIPEGTARRWKSLAKASGDDWDEARHNIGSELQQKAVSDFLDLFLKFQTEIINGLINSDKSPEEKAAIASRISDGFVKTTKAGSRFDPDHMMLIATQRVLKELGTFITQYNPDMAPMFLEIIEPFGTHMLKKSGNGNT